MSRIMELVTMENEKQVHQAANKAGGKVTNVRFLKDTSTESKITSTNSASKKALLIPRAKLSASILGQLDACKLICLLFLIPCTIKWKSILFHSMLQSCTN